MIQRNKALTRDGRQMVIWMYEDMYEAIKRACERESDRHPNRPPVSMAEFVRGAVAAKLKGEQYHEKA